MSGCSRTVLRIFLVASALLILAGNMISAFAMFRIGNALLDSYPGLVCVEGPCKGFSGSASEDFASASSSSTSSLTRQSTWGPDVGWLLNVVALAPLLVAAVRAAAGATVDAAASAAAAAAATVDAAAAARFAAAAASAATTAVAAADDDFQISAIWAGSPDRFVGFWDFGFWILGLIMVLGFGFPFSDSFAANGKPVLWSIYDACCV